MSYPALARPSVNLMTLRDGTPAIAISGGPNRVLVRRQHIDALFADLEEIEEELSK